MYIKRVGARSAALLLIAASFLSVSALTQSASAATVTDPGALISLSPSRILDTRPDQHTGVRHDGSTISGQIAAGQTVDLQVAGVGGVPVSGVGSVVLNLTVTNPTGSGYVTVFPGDVASPPNASNLNFTPGLTIPNLVTVRLGSGGDVKIYVGGAGAVDVIADVSGYYVGGTPSAAGTMSPLQSPYRALDTRVPIHNPVAAGTPRNLVLAGQGGLPAAGSISAVVLNVTITAPTTSGYLTAYPGSSSMPNSSNLNFVAGQTIPNSVTVKTGPGGDVNLAVGGSNTLSGDVIVDVAGYYLAGSATNPGTFVSLPPTRILETRSGSGYTLTGVSSPGVTAGTPIDLTVAGHGGVPSSGVGAVLMNTTMIDPSVPGYVVAYPGGTSVPNASNLNFGTGITIPGLVNVKLGASGDVKLLYASSPVTGAGNLVADVAGYFRQGDAPSAPAPGPVLGLSAAGVNAGEVDLAWTNPSYATGVTICRAKTNVAMTPATCAANGGTVFNAPTGATGMRDYWLYWTTTYYYTAWATNSSATSSAATAVGTTLSNANSRQKPASNTQPSGLYNCDYGTETITQACATGAVTDFNAARARDGLGPMALPDNFWGLPTQWRLFVLTNIDRVDRGMAPVDGLSTSLSSQAAASPYGQDPAFPAGTTDGGSNWASTVNPFWTQFLWMYDDGLNSPNSDCTSTASAGCWGHRTNVLMPHAPNVPISMGDSISSSSGTGALYIGNTTAWMDWPTPNWADEKSHFPKGCPENP